MFHAPISTLISVLTLIMTLLLTTRIIQITNIKNLLNYIISLIDTLIDIYNIIHKDYDQRASSCNNQIYKLPNF